MAPTISQDYSHAFPARGGQGVLAAGLNGEAFLLT